jgi:hypothetical protein
MHIEAWFLIEAIIASVYLSSEPDSFASASSLAISELTGIDELVVDLSSESMVLSIKEIAFIDLSRNPAFSTKSVFESSHVDLSNIFLEPVHLMILFEKSQIKVRL